MYWVSYLLTRLKRIDLLICEVIRIVRIQQCLDKAYNILNTKISMRILNCNFPKIEQRSECKHIAANISLELEQGKLPQGRFRAQEQPQILVH